MQWKRGLDNESIPKHRNIGGLVRKAVRPLPLRAAAVSNVGLVEKPGRVEIFCELTCYDRCRLTLLGSVDGGESWMFKIDAGKGDAGERLAEGA